jgi:hypothetical protein
MTPPYNDLSTVRFNSSVARLLNNFSFLEFFAIVDAFKIVDSFINFGFKLTEADIWFL